MQHTGARQIRKCYKTGDIIAHEGESSIGFLVLLSGKVGVFKGQMLAAQFTQPGIIFGELSVILGGPRTATLKALETTEAVNIPLGIEDLVRSYPDITKKILMNLAERLVKTTADFSATLGTTEEKIDS
jgi:CRP-like cAMP-binding protein